MLSIPQPIRSATPPCVVAEDADFLVANKPPGWNTHAPSPYAGEGIYDWLRHREPRWVSLSIVHRLDKETSGLLVFGKTPAANRSLTQQFTDRRVRKNYEFLTPNRPAETEWTTISAIARAGENYVSRPLAAGGDYAETHFQLLGPVLLEGNSYWAVRAEPKTGRTHQIRVHAAAAGCPMLGDERYGGAPFRRLCLHAARLGFTHPVSGVEQAFESAPDFAGDPRRQLRAAFILPGETNAFRLHHGAADGETASYVDQLGDLILVQQTRDGPPSPTLPLGPRVYLKSLRRDVRQTTPIETSPRHVAGAPASERFAVRENGLNYELSLAEGYSVGLFFDQRDNRRRLLTNHIAADFPVRPGATDLRGSEVLNAFAYTCGFSVCAAHTGARTTSLDLSRKYLDWGRRNFSLNGLDPAGHDFIFGDCFDWLRRLAKKQRRFDVVLLDPPTFSRSKEHGDFRAERDYPRLIAAAAPLVRPGGILFASTNAARLDPEDFLAGSHAALTALGRRVSQQHYAPQAPDFPVNREEPAYLKTVWWRLE